MPTDRPQLEARYELPLSIDSQFVKITGTFGFFAFVHTLLYEAHGARPSAHAAIGDACRTAELVPDQTVTVELSVRHWSEIHDRLAALGQIAAVRLNPRAMVWTDRYSDRLPVDEAFCSNLVLATEALRVACAAHWEDEQAIKDIFGAYNANGQPNL